ncbi:glycosyltransferase family 2 protein [Methanobrevibacter sp.]
MECKISIIIPMFNREKTISRCLNSVLNQKWEGDLSKDIEIVVVDDCSTDSSKEIVMSYMENNSNIHLFSTETNSGYPGKPRNIGIANSNSKYIMFLDSDDEYDENMCKTLFDEIENSYADLVCCNRYNFDEIDSTKSYAKYPQDTPVKNGKVFFDNETIFYLIDLYLWNKIFKSQILKENKIYFKTDKLAEEDLFLYQYYLDCTSNCFIHLMDYFGYKRHETNDSISQSYSLNDLIGAVEIITEGYEILKGKDLNFSLVFQSRLSTIIFRTLQGSTLDESYEKLVKLFEKINDFEKDINFSLPIMIDIANKLILKKKYRLTIYYLKFLRKIKNSNFLIKFYRRFILR